MWCLQKIDQIPLIKKDLCFVIPMKLLANNKDRTFGRDNHDKTE